MTVDYKPLAADPGANVISQADFLIALAPGGTLEKGYKAGTALSAQVNKVSRQGSVMTAALANAIVNVIGGDVLDDGNVTALTAKLQALFVGSAWSTGDVKLTLKTVADTGWIMANDGTIGSVTSGATYANAAAELLFKFIWSTIPQTWAVVVTGRGASANADWAANKQLTLTRMLGRALALAGTGLGLTARALGEFDGAEAVVLTTAQTPVKSHAHGVSQSPHVHDMGIAQVDSGHAGGGGFPVWGTGQGSANTGGANANISIDAASDATASGHPNVPPESFLNAMIKL